MIDIIATEGHFLDHLAPIRAALPPALRGRVITAPAPAPLADAAAVLVASYGDHKRARALGYRRIARAEHGAGQSYAGDGGKAGETPNYAGGRDADDVTLFLVPGPHPAQRWRQAYPRARVEVVGTPRLDDLPAREPDDGPPVVAISFHFNAYIGASEGDGAFRWYRDSLPDLARRFRVIGHAHPRHADRVRGWFRRSGIPFVDSFADVCRQADLYVCDNSSTIFEFAATGRPVVLLNAPIYRRDIDHGLRFWSAAHVGAHAQPGTLGAVLERSIADGPDERQAREHALSLVYAHRTGGAALAAAALVDWHEAAA